MRNILFGLLFLLIINYSNSIAQDYEITKVIKVGPCGGGPLFRPVKWSPDGSMIAYFNRQKLMVSDTLGETREVFTINYVARPFEWISDSEIVLYQREYNNNPYRKYKLSIITLSGTETVLEEEEVSRFVRPRKPSFSPPRKTPTGIVYYDSDAKRTDDRLIILTRAKKSQPISPSEHYYVTSVGGNLCKISLDDKDTLTVLPGRYAGVVVNKEFGMMLAEGPDTTAYLYNLRSGSCDTIYFPRVQPREDVFCSVMGYEFNSVENQVIYFVTCDEKYGDYTTKNAICLYDISRKRSIALSPLTESDYESSPLFSPNGRYFSFVAGGVGVCIAILEISK